MTIRKKSLLFFSFLLAVILSLLISLSYLLHLLKSLHHVPGRIEIFLSFYSSFLAVMVVLFFTFLLVFSRRRIIKPLEHLEKSTRLYNANQSGFSLPLIGRDEIGSLALSIDKMIKTIETQKEMMARDEKLSALGLMAAGIAHEINNPISFIKSNFQTLEEYLEQIEQTVSLYAEAVPDHLKPENHEQIIRIMNDTRELIKDNREGILRIHEIVSNIRGLSRMDTLAANKPVDLKKCVKGALTASGHSSRKNPEIIWESRAIPPVSGTEEKLHQILLNLLNNARHAIPAEGGIIKIGFEKDPSWIYCSIGDNGPGITEENRSKIFDPFFTTKAAGKGTGLGLNVSYQIMKHLGGEIRVDTSEWGGARFTLKFPNLEVE